MKTIKVLRELAVTRPRAERPRTTEKRAERAAPRRRTLIFEQDWADDLREPVRAAPALRR